MDLQYPGLKVWGYVSDKYRLIVKPAYWPAGNVWDTIKKGSISATLLSEYDM